MSTTNCVHCEAELATGWYLCHQGSTRLEKILARTIDTWATVQTTLERRDVGAPSNGGNGGHSGSIEPCNLDVVDKAFTLELVLNGWAGLIPAMRPVNREPHMLTAWMLSPEVFQLIRQQDWAMDLMTELGDALQPLIRAVDRAAPKSFAGMCPTKLEVGATCSKPLYTRPGEPIVTCRTCNAEWDATLWRSEAIQAAGHTNGTPAQLSRMISNPVTGEALPASTIRSWIRRRHLTPISLNNKGEPVYQVRKVRNLWRRNMVSKYQKNHFQSGQNSFAA